MDKFSTRFPTEEQFIHYIHDVYGDYHKVRWVIGGINGGNCWDDGGHYSLTAEEEPEFESLDNILMDVYPSLTFLQYRKLMNEDFIKYSSKTQYEYYGNYTEYKDKELDFSVLYRTLSLF